MRSGSSSNWSPQDVELLYASPVEGGGQGATPTVHFTFATNEKDDDDRQIILEAYVPANKLVNFCEREGSLKQHSAPRTVEIRTTNGGQQQSRRSAAA